jgi:hypothetical protein
MVLHQTPHAEDTMRTLADKWKDEGRAEAVATLADKWKDEGRAEGKAEGKAEGRRTTLVQLLTLKFGALSEVVETRISVATEAQLERWSARVLSEATLDGVLDED